MSEVKKENPLVKYVGTCPICGIGKMAEGDKCYVCNHVSKENGSTCRFTIWKEYYGRQITLEQVKQLLENSKTEVMELTSQAGKKFNGYLYIAEDNFVKMEFANNAENLPQLETPCPICGEPVYIYNKGYGCKGYHENDENGERKCNLWISSTIAHRRISQKEAEQLLQERRTGFLEGFESNSGNEFTSRLVLDDDGNIALDSTICKCPKCGDGDIKIGTKSYNCTNYRTKGCNFTIWKEMGFRKISPEEVIQLCENKATDVLDGFKKKDKTYSARLILNDELVPMILE